MYKIYLRHGRPPAVWPLQTLMNWAQGPAFTTNLHYALLTLVLSTLRPNPVGLFPITCLAVFHLMAYASSTLKGNSLWEKYGRPLHAMLAK